MRRLVENDEHHGAERQQPRHQERDSSYSDFLATHLPVFADVTDSLEADNWLHTIELKLGFFIAQSIKRLYMLCNNWVAQLEPGGLHASPPYLLITKFHGASFVLLFHAHHLYVGLLRTKLKEFLDFE
jgi:hypothetical protein